jgi:superfamily II DNA helicase RecQ
MSQLVFMPTVGGKTALFYIPILVALYMHQKPGPQFKPLPSKPVVLVVVPLNELGNNHVHIQVFEGVG